jgi:hypothetical protein
MPEGIDGLAEKQVADLCPDEPEGRESHEGDRGVPIALCDKEDTMVETQNGYFNCEDCGGDQGKAYKHRLLGS